MASSFYYSDKELEKIKNYKSGITIDKSLIYKYLVSPFCAFCVQFLPSWIAPNLLTLLGLVCNIISFFLAVIYLPDNPNPPRWVYLACAFLIFSYMILDNCDGKQAVRTGNCSPLGELLDHGCDSQIISMGVLTTGYVILSEINVLPVWVALGMGAFYLAHWQEYFCNFLELGYFNGPTEAEVSVIIIYLLTYFTGPSWWKTQYSLISIKFTPSELITYILVGIAIFTIITTLWKGSSLAMKRGVKLNRAFSALIPFSLSWIAGVIWLIFSPSLYATHSCLFLISFNFLFSYLVIHCIIQRMCDLPYRIFYIPTIPIFFAAINAVFSYSTGKVFIDGNLILYGATIYWFIVLVHFSVSLVQSLCKILKINALTIPYPNKGTKSH
jgi:ethanolaminephosphotransferase